MQLALKWGGLEAWGTEMMYPHYSTAWAWAGNTPFRWGKQVASHLGGTRNPLVIRWPARIEDGGGLRSQFTHVTDVGPMILDIAGIPQPTHVDGVEQQPMTGVTFAGSSPTRTPPSTTPRSTSRTSVTGRCTRTAGGCRCGCPGPRGVWTPSC